MRSSRSSFLRFASVPRAAALLLGLFAISCGGGGDRATPVRRSRAVVVLRLIRLFAVHRAGVERIGEHADRPYRVIHGTRIAVRLRTPDRRHWNVQPRDSRDGPDDGGAHAHVVGVGGPGNHHGHCHRLEPRPRERYVHARAHDHGRRRANRAVLDGAQRELVPRLAGESVADAAAAHDRAQRRLHGFGRADDYRLAVYARRRVLAEHGHRRLDVALHPRPRRHAARDVHRDDSGSRRGRRRHAHDHAPTRRREPYHGQHSLEVLLEHHAAVLRRREGRKRCVDARRAGHGQRLLVQRRVADRFRGDGDERFGWVPDDGLRVHGRRDGGARGIAVYPLSERDGANRERRLRRRHRVPHVRSRHELVGRIGERQRILQSVEPSAGPARRRGSKQRRHRQQSRGPRDSRHHPPRRQPREQSSGARLWSRRIVRADDVDVDDQRRGRPASR